MNWIFKAGSGDNVEKGFWYCSAPHTVISHLCRPRVSYEVPRDYDKENWYVWKHGAIVAGPIKDIDVAKVAALFI
jgi:hypothetical protein